MSQALANLLRILALQQLEQQVFKGESQDLGYPMLFGGHVLGQALVAASRTVEADKSIHSLHAYFLRPGNATECIYYEVDLIRSGTSFVTRRVVAKQGGLAILSLSASFHRHEDGLAHQAAPMPVVPGPEGVLNEQQLMQAHLDHLPASRKAQLTADRAVEIRAIDPVLPGDTAPRPPQRYTWLKAAGPMPQTPLMHQAVTAYSSDMGLAMTSLLPHGKMLLDPQLQLASLDHAMWFHRPLLVDQWYLYAMDSPSSEGGRGFNRGQIYTRDGVLAVSVAQEGLVRIRKKREKPT